MAEHVCIEYKKEFNLPIVIFRPSIVCSTENDPMTGWCDNLNGPMGLVIVTALGVTHVMHIKPTRAMNMVPVDICVKGMILSAYKVWWDKIQNQVELIPVYNAASIKIVSYESLNNSLVLLRKHPSMKTFGIPYMTCHNCIYYAWILRIFRNLIPALIVDGLLCISNKKPK